jgi:hypothetical protein
MPRADVYQIKTQDCTKPLSSRSIWGQIKTQDDHHSEAIHTITKFCSDPKSVLSGAYKIAKILITSIEARAFNYQICQGEAMGTCRLQTVGKARRQCCITTQPHVCFPEVCRRHAPLPIHTKQRYKSIATGCSDTLRTTSKHIGHRLFNDLQDTIKSIAARALFPWATSQKHIKKGPAGPP